MYLVTILSLDPKKVAKPEKFIAEDLNKVAEDYSAFMVEYVPSRLEYFVEEFTSVSKTE